MSDDNHTNPGNADKDKALLDPGAVFDSPEQVLEDSALTQAQKTDILRRWYYDQAEIDVAGEEGMPGMEDDALAGRILAALKKLTGDTDDVDGSGPTKQHGLPSRDER